MKPPTPAMIRALRLVESLEVACGARFRTDTRTALAKRGLIEPTPETRDFNEWVTCWQLTAAGRRVLAEHTTTGDE